MDARTGSFIVSGSTLDTAAEGPACSAATSPSKSASLPLPAEAAGAAAGLRVEVPSEEVAKGAGPTDDDNGVEDGRFAATCSLYLDCSSMKTLSCSSRAFKAAKNSILLLVGRRQIPRLYVK
jgi:hypothetical protein